MKKIVYLFAISLLSVFLSGCASAPKEIPENLSAAQLIQLGQNEYLSGKYKAAEEYYLTTIKRYGMDTATYVEVKYELGHLYIAQKKYQNAYDAFKEIQEIYDYAAAGDLPASYKKLAAIGLSKIPEEKLKDFEKKAQSAQKQTAGQEE